MQDRISKAELAEIIAPMLKAMRLPKGIDPDGLKDGYFMAVAGFTRREVEDAFMRFMRGEAEGLSKTYMPTPPELADIIRNKPIERAVHGEGRKRRAYRKPGSRILESSISKDRARELVRNGVHPHGSIWCPGPFGAPDVGLGDLYGPDAGWNAATLGMPEPRFVPRDDDPKGKVPSTPEERAVMSFKLMLLKQALGNGKIDKLAAANRRSLEDMIGLAQDWGEPVPELVWQACANHYGQSPGLPW